MRLILQTSLFSCILAFHLTSAFSDGSLYMACYTMYPMHLSFGAKNSYSPYTVFAIENPDGSFDVTIDGATEYFRGFMLEAFDAYDYRVGIFTAVPPTARLLECDFIGGAVSHSSPIEKRGVTVRWEPRSYVGPVIFKATVVKSYTQFWTNIHSQMHFVDRNPFALLRK